MKTAEIFDGLLSALKLGDTASVIARRREEITKTLNKDFRSKEGCSSYSLMVGSFGRHTAIKGVSDLDMIYVLPANIRDNYAGDTGPRRMLERVCKDLKARYPSTDIRVDQCVVRVQFATNSFKFDVQPAFENADCSFSYPDTKSASWKTTKPRDEIQATRESVVRTSANMRHLARMARAWKNATGVAMGGLLIDTLVYRFFEQTHEFDAVGSSSFDRMVCDFFEFLKNEPDKDYYSALGSCQRVYVKDKFQPKAKKAHSRCVEAMKAEGTSSANVIWRQVFGRSVPLVKSSNDARSFRNTEEFIEDRYPVEISETVSIDCDVTQDGWRPMKLREMLSAGTPLKVEKKLRFKVVTCSVPQPYTLKWKVLNRGPEAERRNCIRGQIVDSTASGVRDERSDFRGKHLVECYIVKDGIVVARDHIDVPISTTSARPSSL